MKDALEYNTDAGQALFKDALDLGNREIAGINPEEQAAYDQFLGEADQSNWMGDQAWNTANQGRGSDALDYHNQAKRDYGFSDRVGDLGGFDHGYTPGEFSGGYQGADYSSGYDPSYAQQSYGPRDFESGYQNTSFDSGYGGPKEADSGYKAGDYSSDYNASEFDSGYQAPSEFDGGYQAPTEFDHGYAAEDYRGSSDYDPTTGTIENGYTGDRLTDMIGGKDFESDYTDSVVDTTLAGIQRQADRDRVARAGRQAAVGGLGGTRSSVENALADNLTNQSMASTEAQLRADAERFGADKLLQQAGMLDKSDVTRGQMDMDAAAQNEEMRKFAAKFGLDEAQLSEQAKQFMSGQELTSQGMADAAAQFMSNQNLTEQDMLDQANRFASEMGMDAQKAEEMSRQFASNMGLDYDKLMEQSKTQAGKFKLDEFGMSEDTRQFAADMGLNEQKLGDMSNQFAAQMDMNEQELADDSARMAQEFGLSISEMNDMRDRFAADKSLQEQELTDSSNRYGSDQKLREQELADSASRFLSGQDLSQQNMEEMAKQFGLGFDKSLMDAGQNAQQYGMDYDQRKAGLLDTLAGTNQQRASGVYGLMDAFGGRNRAIDQARMDAPRNQLDWLSSILTGRQSGNAMLPVGSTQTTTTPGNSALQNALGIATGLGGAALSGGMNPFGFLTSDERVKEDIDDPDESALDKLRKLQDGAKEYQYKDGFGHVTGRTSGLMAQDIERAGITGAVVEIGGVKHVDPYPVLATVVQAVKELDDEKRSVA